MEPPVRIVSSSAEVIGMMCVDHLHGAIQEHFGERCPDHEPECPACQAWKAWDVLARLFLEDT